jgi:hypothetical protein
MLTPMPTNSAATPATPLPPVPTAVLAGQTLPAAKPVAPAAAANLPSSTTSQIAPAIISLATRTDGSNELTVSLNPRDLGQVQIHLVRGSDGTTAVTVTATQPGTLQELSQNVHHLHSALDAANIPADGRTLNFVVAPAATSDQNQERNDSGGFGASGAQDRGGSASGGQNSGQGQPQGQAWQQGRESGSSQDQSESYRPAAPIASRRQWQLNGLNITA